MSKIKQSDKDGPYYVWANESCDNKCDTLKEARSIVKLFAKEGVQAYITNIDDQPID